MNLEKQPQGEMFSTEEIGPELVDNEPSFAEEHPQLTDLLVSYKQLKGRGESLGSLYVHPGKSEYMHMRNSSELKEFAQELGVNLTDMYYDLNEQ